MNIFIRILFAIFIFSSGNNSLSGQQNLKIISYNVLDGMKNDTSAGKTAFAQWIKKMNPDVMAFQEMNEFTQQRLEEFAHSYGHQYAILLKDTGYPVALTSCYPITNVKKTVAHFHHGFIEATIKDIHFFVLHLSPHKYLKRKEEIDSILSLIRINGSDARVILMGDFNAQSPQDSVFYEDGKMLETLKKLATRYPWHENLKNGKIDFEVIRTVLLNGFFDPIYDPKKLNISHLTKMPAEPGFEYDRSRMDYIFVNSTLKDKVKKAAILKDEFTDYMSDHYPVYLELQY
jgi:exodeoxyribonuclease-3